MSIQWRYYDDQGKRISSETGAALIERLVTDWHGIPYSRTYMTPGDDQQNQNKADSASPELGGPETGIKAVERKRRGKDSDEPIKIELRLEPLGMDRKAAEDYRKKAPQVYAARTQAAVKAFEIELRSIMTSTKETLDMEHVRFLTELAINRFCDTLKGTSEQAVRLLLEDGLASVGIDMLTQKVSPEVVRALYYESPQWTAYSRMQADLITKTNDIIRHHMIVAPSGIDKYGKAHGLDKELMLKDISDIIGVSERRARLISRTESRVIQNKGKELGYKMRDPQGDWRYKLGGPYDPRERGGRLRDACRYVMEHIPKGGYKLDELKTVWKDACKHFQPQLTPRDFSGGPNCRHFPQKVVTTWNVESEVPQEEPYVNLLY